MKMLLLPPYFFPEQTASTHLDMDRFNAYKDNEITTLVYAPIPTRGIDESMRKNTPLQETLFDGSVFVNRFQLMREKRNPIFRAIRYICGNFIQYSRGKAAKEIDVIYSGSTPPTQGLLCGLVKRALGKKYGRYIPYVFCLQDIFPDSLVNAGMTHKGSILWKIGRKIEDFTYKSADKIIVISEGFKKNIVEKGVPVEKIEVISNWIDLEAVQPIDRCNNKLINEFNLDPKKFIVVYAGNFGSAQGADIIIKAAKKLQKIEEIQFVIFGGGPYFEKAKDEAKGISNVFIHGLMPQERISDVYSLGDVALITCKTGTGKAGMPSKTWSIMACNTPIIAAFDIERDLGEVIRHSKAGECIEPENVDALVDAILRAKNCEQKQVDLRTYVRDNASKEACVNRYVQVIKNVAKERR